MINREKLDIKFHTLRQQWVGKVSKDGNTTTSLLCGKKR